MRSTILAGFAALAMATHLYAQTPPVQGVVAKTVELRHLTPKEAVKLLGPYVINGGGGVYEVSDNLAIVTIKDLADNIPRMELVLAKYDRSPATIRLVFQLIRADTSLKSQAPPGRRIADDLDSALRSVLKFHSYQLLSQAITSVGEFAGSSQTLAGLDTVAPLTLSTSVGAIRLADRGTAPSSSSVANATGSVRLDVRLTRPLMVLSGMQAGGGASIQKTDEWLISTGLDVPLGQTVVLGTAATTTAGTAFILTVRPELVAIKP